jgi:hypothetical protein
VQVLIGTLVADLKFIKEPETELMVVQRMDENGSGPCFG